MRRAAAVAVLAACGSSTAVPDAPIGPIDRHASLAGGAYLELNVDVPTGSRVTAAFTAAAPVAWDVHSHPGGQVVVHQQGEQAAGTIEVAPAAGSAYSLLWTNEGASAIELDLHVELAGGASFISWLPN